MVKNIIKTAFRVFWKERGYSLLNILGLTVGICASLLLFLYIQDEYAVNKFHENTDRIYRVMEHQHYSDDIFTTNGNPGPLKDAFKEELPEVEYIAQVTWEQERLFIVDNQSFKETGRIASEDFFKVFSFPFVEGSAEGALVAPDVAYLSESLAKKIFGEKPALNETVTINGWGDYRIGGVFADVPANSTVNFDFMLPIAPWMEQNDWLEEWGNNGIRDFMTLHEGVDIDAFNAKILNFIKEHDEGSSIEIFAQNLGDLYLYNKFKDGKQAGGRITYVRLFTVVAIFILVIACINFMNLATARASKRAKEIGIKKVTGSTRGQLIAQFMGESIIMALVSSVLAGLLVMVLLPGLNDFTGKEMAFSILHLPSGAMLLGVALTVGILAGSYPSVFLSSFAPVKVLKGTFRSSGWSAGIRKGLVVFQFLVSIFLIIGTMVVHKQISFVKDKNLGYSKDNLIYLPVEGDLANRLDVFKSRMLENPNIKSMTTSSAVPIYLSSSTSGGFRWEGKDPESSILFQLLLVGHDFFQTFDMEMERGRAFDERLSSDTANIVVNEVTAASMALEEPLNYPVNFWGREGQLVGIVKNFHFASLHSRIEPLVISLRPERAEYVFLKIDGQNTEEALAYVEEGFKELNPRYPFEYEFLDQSYADLYERETNIGALANYFAAIAVFISLLGLFGLASFAAEQRIKEIGIRKVLGAGVGNLVLLLARNFLVLVVLGFGLAVPLAWFFMTDWLSAFEYQVSIGAGIFLIAGGSSVLVALLTVSYHSLRAAYANPVKSLRYE